jgi:cell division septation protein DedD
MNNTTVKRGIGAVVLALIAAGLLAFLLKDKAAQRQEVVEIALPGTTENSGTSTQSTRLPTLTTDNSGNGNVIANAGNGNGVDAATAGSSAGSATSGTGNTASSTNSDGTIIASAAAVGAAAVGQVATNAKSMDFSVKPKAAQAPKASSEFLELDLVNNGTSASSTASTGQTKALAVPAQKTAAPSSASTDQGVVIASTSPKSNTRANTVQPRLIGEKRSAPVKSASTAKVIKKVIPAKKAKATETKAAPASTTTQAKNGYAIQLLATSSQSRANNLKNVMAGEGYPAYVTKTKQNGKTLYRVRIGQYAVKSEAVKFQSSMKRRYKKNTNVNRSAVVAR